MHCPACEKISPMNAGKYLGVKKHIHRKLANRTIQHIQYYHPKIIYNDSLCVTVSSMTTGFPFGI